MQKTVEFEDNVLTALLYGEHNSHLKKIENDLSITLLAKGNQLTIKGEETELVDFLDLAIRKLWERLGAGLPVGFGEIKALIRVAKSDQGWDNKQKVLEKMTDIKTIIKTPKRTVTARSANQTDYLTSIDNHNLVFGVGPAGTGKTFLAVAKAVEFYQKGDVERIILCRPAVEAGERLGFLPGDMKEKVDPYFRPIYDSLHDLMGGEAVNKKIESADIEIAPLAFMRGRTLSNSFIILDEAQNTTSMQMKMFLTRLGPNSHMVVTGDQSQIDLPKGTHSGLVEALEILSDVQDVGFISFTKDDVVRHSLVTKIIDAYDRAQK